MYEEETSNKGLWALFIVSLLTALVFAVLWYLRGGEIGQLNDALRSTQAQASSTAQRLESNLRNARSDMDTASRRINELETRVRDEQRRGTETAQQVERRMRTDLDLSAGRVRALTSQLDEMRAAALDVAVLEETQDRLAETEKQLVASRESGQNLTDELAAISDNLAKLQQEKDALQTAHDGVSAELLSARAQVANHPKVAQLTSELLTAGAAMEALKATHDDTERRLAAAREEAQRNADRPQLAKQLMDARDTIAGLNQKIVDFQSARDELAKEADAEEALAQLAEAHKTITGLEGRVGDLEANRDHLTKELETANEELRKDDTTSEVSDQLAAAKQHIAGLELKIGDLEANRDHLAKELTGVQEDLLKNEQAATVGRELEEARQTIAELTDKAAQAENRRKSLEDSLERSHAANGTHITLLQDKLVKANATIEDWKANADHIGQELTTAYDDLDKSEKAKKTVQDQYTAMLASARQGWDREKASLNDEMTKLKEAHTSLASDKDERIRQLEGERDSLTSKLDELQKKPVEPVQSAAPQTPAPRPDSANIIAPAPGSAQPTLTVMANPSRAVGRVVEKMLDGITYIIDKGQRQGVREGMRFDVHRQLGGYNRFSGILRVVQPMEDYSLAVAESGNATTLCPVTGRAYLEPGAKQSPFAMGEGGRPVPLVTAESVGLVGEVPAVGDVIDNPFFDPNRRLVFGVSPELRGEERVQMAVDSVGGVLNEEAETGVDYVLVPENGAFSGDIGGPRRVTPEHVASYSK